MNRFTGDAVDGERDKLNFDSQQQLWHELNNKLVLEAIINIIIYLFKDYFNVFSFSGDVVFLKASSDHLSSSSTLRRMPSAHKDNVYIEHYELCDYLIIYQSLRVLQVYVPKIQHYYF